MSSANWVISVTVKTQWHFQIDGWMSWTQTDLLIGDKAAVRHLEQTDPIRMMNQQFWFQSNKSDVELRLLFIGRGNVWLLNESQSESDNITIHHKTENKVFLSELQSPDSSGTSTTSQSVASQSVVSQCVTVVGADVLVYHLIFWQHSLHHKPPSLHRKPHRPLIPEPNKVSC